MMPIAWIALGSNLGDRAGYLSAARDALAATPQVGRIDAGPIRDTAPLGGVDQPRYLNQLLRVDTALDAARLLATCHAIERSLGRGEHSHWASRTIDVDLVRHADLLCDLPALRLPHPGLRDREFWALDLAALEADA